MINLIAADDNWAKGFLDWVLPKTETVVLETKRVSGKMVGKALDTLCAFANTQGGWLVLGVEDAGKAKGRDRLYGVEENQEAIDELLRKLLDHHEPAIARIVGVRFKTAMHDGALGTIVALQVEQSDKVHSVRGGGTWIRGTASNRAMNASEITELSYQRGVRSAESEPVDISSDLLETDMWRQFVRARGLAPTGLMNQLYRIGLAKKVGEELRPLRAAVLLFADHPGALLAGTGTRADVRVFHYKGTHIESDAVPNLKKTPKTLSGPLYRLIDETLAYVMNELADGLTLAKSGFRTVHRYPERVVKEAITNAVIHRDYRLNRDIQIRIFDSRIEVLSPGLLPGRITPSNIHRTGSFSRNPLLATNLREFLEPPNIDAGEGVPMMFTLMRDSDLYPPEFRELREQVQEAVRVTLRNEERPPMWEQVSDWMDRNGSIGNSQLCSIANLDTLKASKLLKRWVDQGLLVPDASKAKRNMVYMKPSAVSNDVSSLFSAVPQASQGALGNLMP